MEQLHEGHRQRMFERLMKHPDSLNDHEILEILLYFSIPRVNTNELAHALLEAFGDLPRIFEGTFEQFMSVKGVGKHTATHLLCLKEIHTRLTCREAPERKAINMRSFVEIVSKKLSNLRTEVLELYCLDRKHQISFVQQFTDNKADEVGVNVWEINELIVAQKPHAVIIVHNHPTGAVEPSEQDDQFTAQIQLLCSFSNVLFYDHIIVGQGNPYSYHLSGRLEIIKGNFDIAKLLQRRNPMYKL